MTIYHTNHPSAISALKPFISDSLRITATRRSLAVYLIKATAYLHGLLSCCTISLFCHGEEIWGRASHWWGHRPYTDRTSHRSLDVRYNHTRLQHTLLRLVDTPSRQPIGFRWPPIGDTNCDRTSGETKASVSILWGEDSHGSLRHSVF